MIQALLKRSVALVPWSMRNRVRRVPAVAFVQRWLLTKLLAGEEFVHAYAGPARSLKYPICLPEDKGIWTGTYELGFTTALARKVNKGDICLDLGGWHGFLTGVMALAGARQVYVFEPLPVNCARIRRLIELNPSLPIRFFEAAVGDRRARWSSASCPMTAWAS